MEPIREFNNLDNQNFANVMNLLVQAPHEEESKEYFTLLQSLDYNEDGRLKSNREDHYSRRMMLQNGKSNVIEDLEFFFNEIIYLILTKSA